MIGQWIGRIDGELPATLRIEIEDRGFGLVGRGYLFYDNGNLPGFLFDINLAKGQPLRTKVITIYLYPAGGVMTAEHRRDAEAHIAANYDVGMPPEIDVEFSSIGAELIVTWSGASPGPTDTSGVAKRVLRLVQKQSVANERQQGVITMELSDPDGASVLTPRNDLSSWDQFRHWATGQHPRNFIFRGQRQPFKLATTFHRTWRKNLNLWITQDIELLFGTVAEHLKYPLQLGNLQHNTAIWSILQHHGYPTPMLDWSYSPFVAAYFAFQEAIENNVSPRIFIFDRVAWTNRYGRLGFIVDPAPNQLVVVESMPTGNPRHAPQQAISTVTNVADVEAFIRGREDADGMSYLTACDLPIQSKPQIMRELELMGITYGSLFPGLDGICRDMRSRLFAPPSQ
ncbi:MULTISPECIES: FRG domain-containing protein [Sphingobium]|uniref:FRG domain-containing protein n=1 Tax=Sphingobium sp. MI1205 TaxID=407020 RepID=UPI000B07482C|nr:FRG domain-containing protein [Sphingobium sp. MI1205]